MYYFLLYFFLVNSSYCLSPLALMYLLCYYSITKTYIYVYTCIGNPDYITLRKANTCAIVFCSWKVYAVYMYFRPCKGKLIHKTFIFMRWCRARIFLFFITIFWVGNYLIIYHWLVDCPRHPSLSDYFEIGPMLNLTLLGNIERNCAFMRACNWILLFRL